MYYLFRVFDSAKGIRSAISIFLQNWHLRPVRFRVECRVFIFLLMLEAALYVLYNLKR